MIIVAIVNVSQIKLFHWNPIVDFALNFTIPEQSGLGDFPVESLIMFFQCNSRHDSGQIYSFLLLVPIERKKYLLILDFVW